MHSKYRIWNNAAGTDQSLSVACPGAGRQVFGARQRSACYAGTGRQALADEVHGCVVNCWRVDCAGCVSTASVDGLRVRKRCTRRRVRDLAGSLQSRRWAESPHQPVCRTEGGGSKAKWLCLIYMVRTFPKRPSRGQT